LEKKIEEYITDPMIYFKRVFKENNIDPEFAINYTSRNNYENMTNKEIIKELSKLCS
jgi:hypothetical protein